MKLLELKQGGHPLKNDDFNFMQTSYAEVFKGFISIFDPNLNCIMSGVVITETVSDISFTSGYVSWQGEPFVVEGGTFSKVVGGQLYFKLVEDVIYPSPVTYKDQSVQIVHVDRKLTLTYYTAGDTGEYFAAFTRVSSLGFKRGMMVEFQGNISTNFDSTGLGINDMAGFAVCNGGTFTISGGMTITVPDRRGRKSIGASNVPSDGAPVYDSTLGTYPAGSINIAGKNSIVLTKNQLPNYELPITDPGHYHFTIVDESFNSGNFPYEVGRKPAVNRAIDVYYNKSTGGGRESYYLAGCSGTFPTVQPGIGPTSKAETGIIVKSGGNGDAIDVTGAWYAPIIAYKL